MKKIFNINGVSVAPIKDVNNDQYQQFINMVQQLPSEQIQVISVEDVDNTEASQTFGNIDDDADVKPIVDFINSLPDFIDSPVQPNQETMEDILNFYELLPMNSEEQAEMEANEVEYFKNQVNTLGTEAMYYLYKRVSTVSGNLELWTTQMESIAQYLDYSDPLAVPFNPYTDEYRTHLYAIICNVIENG